MRASTKFIAVVCAVLFVPSAWAQFRGPGGGGAPAATPGAAPGMGSGSFRGFGAPRDPGTMFDFLAKGRPYFLISDTRSLREPLMAFAKEQGIVNEQITRDQFVAFYAKMDKYRAPGSTFPPGPGFGPPPGVGGPPVGGSTPPTGIAAAPGQNPLEAIGQWAEADFRRRDNNGDGKLTPDEMSETLRGQLDRWDADRDGLISVDEYKIYYSARLQMRDGAPSATPSNPLTVLIEEDYDHRPDVIRVGKLPKELPKWFAELDGDQDGQVALHEWFKAGKDVDEFKEWDRNDDGFVTAEEVLFKTRGSTGIASAGRPAAAPSSGPSLSASPTRGPGEGFPRPSDGGGVRPGGFGGFFKKKS